MLARIKGWFTPKPGPLDAPTQSKADARIAAILQRAPIPETITSASLPRDRFKVQRIEDGVTYEAYSGDDGVEALEAWEAYQGSEKLGVFTFMDGATCRGSFAR